MDRESQGITYPKVILLSLLIVLIGAFGYYFYISYESPVNHLIEGVPYYGIFNLYAEYPTTVTSIATVLRYHNDERVSFGELKSEFPGPRQRDDDDEESSFQKSLRFFEEQGYETFSINLASKQGKEINEIKKYINQDVPVIVIQQKRLDTKNDDIEKFGWRVVIGIFDNRKKVIVHDAYLGNNYELSYGDFEKLFVPGASRMLAVWPRDALAQSLPKPGNGQPYKERPMVMDEAYNAIGAAGRARTLAAASDTLCENAGSTPTLDQISAYIKLNKESIRYRDEAINNPAFKMLPPIVQFHNNLWKAKSFIRIGEITRAREILINELIPVNSGLDKTAEGFEFMDTISDTTSIRSDKLVDGQMPYVYELLMHTYRYEGRYKEAIEAYAPYFKLNPNDEYALNILSELRVGLSDPSMRKIPNSLRCNGGIGV
jgi:tetratricopeptide (TPR) repeat protein